jgi:hypothetical protein
MELTIDVTIEELESKIAPDSLQWDPFYWD